MLYVCISGKLNHNSTGVTSGVTLVKKIELEIEHNVDKMEYIRIVPKIRVTEQYRKNPRSMVS